MNFLFITLFPEFIEQATCFSIIKRAVEQGLLTVSCINPRDFTHDKHKTVDDTPFGGAVSGGARDMVPVLARAGVAVGVAGLFMETHPKPAEAWSDGPNAVPLKHMKALLETLVALDDVTKKNGFLENNFGA